VSRLGEGHDEGGRGSALTPRLTLDAVWKDDTMFQRITNRVWRRLGSQNSGQDLLEYALLASLIAVVAVTAVTEVGTTIKAVFWDVISATTDAL
jgi:Flp pilus assembly pilin Flp